MGAFDSGRGTDKEAADVGVVGAGAGRGDSGGFARVERAGGSGMGQCGVSSVEGGFASRRIHLR